MFTFNSNQIFNGTLNQTLFLFTEVHRLTLNDETQRFLDFTINFTVDSTGAVVSQAPDLAVGGVGTLTLKI